jgi:hypothetical protein
MVVANLNIKPAEAYVLKYATVKYRVELVKHTSYIGKVCYSQIQSGISQAHIRAFRDR